MSQPLDPLSLANAPHHFFRHLLVMPSWHKGVLCVALVLGIIGGTGTFANKKAEKSGQTHSPANNPNASRPQSPSGFFEDGSPAPIATPPAAAPPASSASAGGMLANVSSPSMKVGISVLAGFVLGWIFRAFLKTMAFLALIVFAGFAVLSYFGILNVDLSQAKQEYATAIQCATDQFWKMTHVLTAHLPSSGGGSVGAFLGFRRR